MEPSQFYTGLVAQLYAPLRSAAPDPDMYAGFIERSGEPALELGCGGGDPLLELRRRGLHVEGLDSSPDMLDRCRARAREMGLEVELHHSTMEEMDLGRVYRSIFLAGATFNLLPDDETALAALRRIYAHLEPNGTALIPLAIPAAVEEHELYRKREAIAEDGTVMRFSTIGATRDEDDRTQRAVLRYERDGEVLEREWVLHWHTQAGFRDLGTEAGLKTRAILGADGAPASEDARSFAFVLTR